jgi:uncharacterized membrane protein
MNTIPFSITAAILFIISIFLEGDIKWVIWALGLAVICVSLIVMIKRQHPKAKSDTCVPSVNEKEKQ